MATRRFTQKKNKNKKRRLSLGKWGRRFLYVFLAGTGIAFLASAGIVMWWSKDLPDPQQIDNRRINESTKIFDSTGTHLLYEIGDIHRTKVPLDKISPHVINASLAAEDAQFYEHRGLDFTGIIRGVVLKPLSGQRAQGGSTITQQLIKNAILTPERTIRRKIKEAVLAIELEQRFSKDEILEMYLNDIPYGSLNYGIEAAAQTFFGTSANNVTLAQAAILASLPKAPTRLSPYGSRMEELKWRQEHVLQRMAELGMISQEEADNAKKEELQFQPRRESIRAPHFVFYVKEMLEQEYGERVVEQGGLRVTTTLDIRLQNIAEESMEENRDQLRSFSASNASLVAINPQNGDILAMVGSVDYFNTDIDGNVNVSIRHRSPGSSIKPFIYTSAFIKGYTPSTVLIDAETDFGQGYTPRNYNLSQNGPVTMRSALANSLNIPAVKTLYLAGINESINLVQRMGMTSLNDPDRYGLSLVLGGGEVRLLDLTSGYGTLANEGVKHPHKAILKVESTDSVLFDDADESSGEEIIKPQIAHLITDVLADNNARAMVFGTGSHLQLGSRPVAAKTGTTQEYRDGWLIGYTPSLVTGVWVGNNNNTEMTDRSGGMRTAGPIWNSFMRKALDGTPIENFVRPAETTNLPHSVLRGELPEITGKWVPETKALYTQDCPLAVGHVRTVKEIRSILYYLDKNNPLRESGNSRQDYQFARWEAGIAAWIEKHNEKHNEDASQPIYMTSLPEPTCPIGSEDDIPKIKIIEPDTSIVKQSPVLVKVEVESKKTIREVRFIFDGEEIGRRYAGEPYETTLSFKPDVSGRKTLEILAITDDLFIGKAHRTFIINPDDNPPEITLHTPFNNSTLNKNDFPLEIKTTATDQDSGIDFVDILYREAGSTSTKRIQRTSTTSSFGPDRYDVKWDTPPSPGQYEIYAIAYDKSGLSTESVKHTVTIID